MKALVRRNDLVSFSRVRSSRVVTMGERERVARVEQANKNMLEALKNKKNTDFHQTMSIAFDLGHLLDARQQPGTIKAIFTNRTIFGANKLELRQFLAENRNEHRLLLKSKEKSFTWKKVLY